jgi:hypothetical protein
MKKLLLISLIAAFAALLPATGAFAAPDQQRVIAQLNVAGDATPQQISAATDSLLASLPYGSYSVNNRYSTLPYVALSAAPEALSVLKQSDLVVGVFDDGVVTASAAPKKAKKCKHGKKSKKSCSRQGTTQNSVS